MIAARRLMLAMFVAPLLACSSTRDPAKPCPSASGVSTESGTDAANCPHQATAGYSTTFPGTERPLSDGNSWSTGKSVGLDWNDVQTTPGKAFGADFATGYNDCIAVLKKSFAPDQYAEGTVHREAGYSPNTSHEIELLLRFQITPHNARGYEVLWGHTGEVNVVRWNGPLGDYTPLIATSGPNIGAAVDGDVLRAEVVGGVITVYKNGTRVLTAPSNTTWTDGQPGLGFWPKPGATLGSYGWKKFEAGPL